MINGKSLVDKSPLGVCTCVILVFTLSPFFWCKEVIQPQVPLRLPCYDFALLKEPRFDHNHEIVASSGPFLGGVTGGVCKEQGRIHRAIMTRDYYAFQLHEGGLQPSIRTTTWFRGLPSPFGVGTHCPSHCSPRVAQGIRGIRTYRRPLLPPAYRWRSP